MKRKQNWKLMLIILCVFVLPPTLEVFAFDCINGGRHEFVIIENVPHTHTEDGFILHACIHCDTLWEVARFATGHVWSEWEVVTAPTCVYYGTERRTCRVGTPHHEERALPPLGHDWSPWHIEREPTCTQSGLMVSTCNRCGERYTQNYGAPLGHTFGDWIYERSPTYEEEGLRFRVCVSCGERVYETLEALIPPLEPEPEEEVESEAEQEVEPDPEPEPEEEPELEVEPEVEEEAEIEAAIPIPPVEPPAPTPPELPLELPQTPAFGIEEILLAVANVCAWVLLALLLLGEFAYVIKDKKRGKLAKARRREAQEEGDGYNFL